MRPGAAADAAAPNAWATGRPQGTERTFSERSVTCPAMKEIDRQRELYREALGLLGVGDVVAAGPVMAPRPQVRGGLRRWFRRRRGSLHPADQMAGLNVLALGDGALWLYRAPKWGAGMPTIERLVGWWPASTVTLASTYKELESLDYDTGTNYRTKVVRIGVKAEGNERLTVVDGLQNDQTRELVREIKQATGQRKN